jgi:hypothetical protein
MRIACATALCALVLLLASCGHKGNPLVKELVLEQSGLFIHLALSSDRDDPTIINGKLRVANAASDMRTFGNSRLFLTVDGHSLPTTVKTSTGTAHADTRLVHLTPGDTLQFFAFWNFDGKVNFAKASFGLQYLADTVAQQAQSPDAAAAAR